MTASATPPASAGPGERERDPAHGRAVGEPERAGRLQRLARLPEERAAAEHVHVRVEHEREHGDRPGRRAHLRQAPAERARLVVLAEQHVHEHVGRHRQRQHERPVEPAPPREVVEGDERGEAAAQHERSRPRRRRPARGSPAAPRAAGWRRSGRAPRPGRRTTPGARAAGPATTAATAIAATVQPDARRRTATSTPRAASARLPPRAPGRRARRRSDRSARPPTRAGAAAGGTSGLAANSPFSTIAACASRPVRNSSSRTAFGAVLGALHDPGAGQVLVRRPRRATRARPGSRGRPSSSRPR